ncbi:type II toxin-antitoxin system RelE/ParE family toxin [Maribrevibacterium harenarium]|uniref:Toxin n=1 Tax=Maribrevibacterium harenarium TaxID=2589817 RepID=A0A501WZZ9_9GAMM|nr:type II toxin-antitoxin system RelE/ParE family toxin [Maribrevibacterium harenarium]
MLEIKIRPLARKDLVEIWRYTAKTWGQPQADLYVTNISTQVSKLADNPTMGRSVDEIFTNCRLYPCGRHILLYQVAHQSLEIVRVLHQSMDVASQPLA